MEGKSIMLPTFIQMPSKERERAGARGRGVWWQYDCMSLCPKFQLQVQKFSIPDTKEKGRNVRKPGVKCPPPDASWRIQAAVLEWERYVAPRKSAAAWAVSSCHFLHVDKDGLCVFTRLFPRFPPFPCFLSSSQYGKQTVAPWVQVI